MTQTSSASIAWEGRALAANQRRCRVNFVRKGNLYLKKGSGVKPAQQDSIVKICKIPIAPSVPRYTTSVLTIPRPGTHTTASKTASDVHQVSLQAAVPGSRNRRGQTTAVCARLVPKLSTSRLTTSDVLLAAMACIKISPKALFARLALQDTSRRA